MCGVSERTLERHFLKSFGKSPKVWLNEQRQTLAKKLLEEGVPVGEVADRLCYSRLTNFSRAFKKYWGKAPTAFTASPATEERACRVLNANGGF